MSLILSASNGVTFHYGHTPAADTIATDTLPDPGTDKRWRIDEILYGYDITPAAAEELTIKLDGITATKTLPVSSDGTLKLTPYDMFGQDETAVVIALSAGGTGVSGYLNIQCTKTAAKTVAVT